MNRNTKSDN